MCCQGPERTNIDVAGKYAVVSFTSRRRYKLCVMRQSEPKGSRILYHGPSINGKEEVGWIILMKDA